MSLVIREAITPTNQSPIFCIVTWILEAATLFAVAIKVVLLQTSIGLHLDDWCILVAASLSVGQVVAASFQGINGIGKIQSSLSATQLVIYEKASYTSMIIYTLTLAASKLSVLFFIYQITPFVPYQRSALAVGIFIAVWSLASLFVSAFQCSSPRWAILGDQCINQTTFWTVYGCINIVTELALIVIPLHMFWTLISDQMRKFVLVFCFSLRLSVIAVIAIQIYFLHHPVHPNGFSYTDVDRSGDFTFATWPAFLCIQIAQSLSIITTCLPFIKSLLLGMETGMFQTGRITPRTLSTASKWNSHSSRETRDMSRISLAGGGTDSNTNSFMRGRSDGFPSIGNVSQRISRHLSANTFSGEVLRSPARIVSAGRNLGVSWQDGWRLSRRREVSMIMEEDDDQSEPLSTSVSGADVAPDQPVIDIDIPSGRISFPHPSGT